MKEGFPGGSDCKESACNVGDLGGIHGLGRSPRGGHGNPLQYSHLENPCGQRSLVSYNSWGRKELDMTEQLSTAQEWEKEILDRGSRICKATKREKHGMCSLWEKGTSLEKASVMWRKLLIAGKIWLKLFHFIYSMSFNPHHNRLKWLLFYHDTEMRKLEHRGLKILFDHLFVVKHVCRVSVDPTNLQYWSCSVINQQFKYLQWDVFWSIHSLFSLKMFIINEGVVQLYLKKNNKFEVLQVGGYKADIQTQEVQFSTYMLGSSIIFYLKLNSAPSALRCASPSSISVF